MRSLDQNRASQRSAILQLLISARGDWVSLLTIKECGAQYNARIFELRRLGHRIVNKISEVDGKRCSWFRLEETRSSIPTLVETRTVSHQETEVQESSFPEFGKMAPERYGID